MRYNKRGLKRPTGFIQGNLDQQNHAYYQLEKRLPISLIDAEDGYAIDYRVGDFGIGDYCGIDTEEEYNYITFEVMKERDQCSTEFFLTMKGSRPVSVTHK